MPENAKLRLQRCKCSHQRKMRIENNFFDGLFLDPLKNIQGKILGDIMICCVVKICFDRSFENVAMIVHVFCLLLCRHPFLTR